MRYRKQTIKLFSTLFLVLTLFLTIWSNLGGLYHGIAVTQVQDIGWGGHADAEDDPANENHQTYLNDGFSFDAVINASVVLDFAKTYLFTPYITHFFETRQQKSISSAVSILLLNYFQNLFMGYILVNAP